MKKGLAASLYFRKVISMENEVKRDFSENPVYNSHLLNTGDAVRTVQGRATRLTK